jgi:hypothetical protein
MKGFKGPTKGIPGVKEGIQVTIKRHKEQLKKSNEKQNDTNSN